MPRTSRKESASSFYHVINRGSGRQVIFENDSDRSFFMERLATFANEEGVKLHAWCLMDNHFHLLVEAPIESLRTLMHRLQTSYAVRFNGIYGHVGPVFGERYKSEAVETDGYLLTLVRYIHENPVKAGLPKGLNYPWSSYNEYVGTPRYANTSFVLSVFGGVKQFLAFHHAEHPDDHCLDIETTQRRRLSDEDAKALADTVLGRDAVLGIKSLSRTERDSCIRRLKEAGLGVRQIQRLSGISLGAISKVKCNRSQREH